jgi:hypothetical protein
MHPAALNTLWAPLNAPVAYSLFALSELASRIFIGGVLADEIGIGEFYFDDDRKLLRLSCGENDEYFFCDQQVELLQDGYVNAVDSPADGDDSSDTYRLRIYIERWITPELLSILADEAQAEVND